MEVSFRDRILECKECGSEFVYTVGQQRMAYEENGSLEEPKYCPVCEVKIERMGRRDEEGTTLHNNEGEERIDGYYTQGDETGEEPPATRVDQEEREAEAAPQFQPGEEEGDEQAAPGAESRQPEPPTVPVSPNRPPDYRSGTEHPLYGHSGEDYTGHVKWFNDRKGFGFITLDNGIEIFVHYSGIVGEGYKTLKQGQRVSIKVEDTEKGPQASHVTVIDDESPPIS